MEQMPELIQAIRTEQKQQNNETIFTGVITAPAGVTGIEIVREFVLVNQIQI